MSPTRLSLQWLKTKGYSVAIAEHWNSFAEIRQDLFGFIDLIAVHPHYPGVLAVQTTTKPNMNARIKKIQANHVSRVWLLAGNEIQVHGWYQQKVRAPWQLCHQSLGTRNRIQ